MGQTSLATWHLHAISNCRTSQRENDAEWKFSIQRQSSRAGYRRCRVGCVEVTLAEVAVSACT